MAEPRVYTRLMYTCMMYVRKYAGKKFAEEMELGR